MREEREGGERGRRKRGRGKTKMKKERLRSVWHGHRGGSEKSCFCGKLFSVDLVTL